MRLFDHTCPTCDKPFKGHPAQRYCYDPCVSPTMVHNRPKRGPRACRQCGEPFTPEHGSTHYCSAKCRHRHHRPLAPPPKPKPCVRCGSAFVPANRNHKYCSEACREKTKRSRSCIRCGDAWVAKGGSWAKLCPGCRELDRQSHVYTTRKAWRNAVRQKANNRCEKCDKTAAESGAPLHAHHILPRAEGGLDTLLNAQLLCVDCHGKMHEGQISGGGDYKVRPLLDDAAIDKIAHRVADLLEERLLTKGT